EDRRRETRGPGQQLRPLLGGRGGEQRLEQLPDESEGELRFQLAAAGREHAQPELGPRGARLGEQARLADPRAALDERETAVAVARGRDQAAQRVDVAVAFQQRRLRTAGGTHTGRALGGQGHFSETATSRASRVMRSTAAFSSSSL